MKPTICWRSIIAAIALTSATLAADDTSRPRERATFESLDLKILRVFSAKDGDAIFRAYLVNWKGQEVVVTDSMLRGPYAEGDVIRVVVASHPLPQGKEGQRVLHFSVVSRQK